jgi:hypothetical protein
MTSFEGKPALGGGGPGPAGGGGGNPGAGADKSAGERLQYVRLNQPKADAAAKVVPPAPVIPPPKPTAAPVPTPQPQPAAAAPSVPLTPLPGSGTGTGGTGAGGAGPGTGGGTGSGVGTGTGSGTGPGTGGGPATNYPPTPTQFFLPPLPAPASLKGYHLTAYFDVDEKGGAKLLGFNPSPDGGYNRKLRDVLLALRFRPGTRPDGTPVRDTVDIQFIF